MLAPKRTKSRAGVNLSVRQNTNSAGELRFITELGRSLLFTVHPKKVALRVAEAVRQEIGAEICAVIVELEHFGLVSCADTSNKNETSQNFLNKSKFKQWLNFLPPQISFLTEDEKDFSLKSDNHKFEYISPLHINGEVKGALIVGYAKKNPARNRRED